MPARSNSCRSRLHRSTRSLVRRIVEARFDSVLLIGCARVSSSMKHVPLQSGISNVRSTRTEDTERRRGMLSQSCTNHISLSTKKPKSLTATNDHTLLINRPRPRIVRQNRHFPESRQFVPSPCVGHPHPTVDDTGSARYIPRAAIYSARASMRRSASRARRVPVAGG